jgi:hypothetical protein
LFKPAPEKLRPPVQTRQKKPNSPQWLLHVVTALLESSRLSSGHEKGGFLFAGVDSCAWRIVDKR